MQGVKEGSIITRVNDWDAEGKDVVEVLQQLKSLTRPLDVWFDDEDKLVEEMEGTPEVSDVS